MLDGLRESLSQWNVIVGLIVVVLAFALMLAAKPLARKILKDSPEQDREKLGLILKIASGVLAVVGCVFVMFIGYR